MPLLSHPTTSAIDAGDQSSASAADLFTDRPWHGLLPARIDPGTTYATLIESGLLLRVEARLLHQGRLDWSGSWRPILDELVSDILSLYDQPKAGRRGEVEGFIRCDLEKFRSGEWAGVDTTAGAIDADEAERCGQLAVEIVQARPGLQVGDVTSVLTQLVRCHHINAWHHRPPFWGRLRLAEWCGFVAPGATETDAASQGKRVDRIVQRIRQDVEGGVRPLIVRTLRGHTGRASEYRFLWENWGGVFARYATDDAAIADQGGWRGSG